MANQPQSEPVLPNFSTFYETWLTNQRSFLQQLVRSISNQTGQADKEQSQLQLITQVLAHYQQYYDHLSTAASEDIFQVLSAPWLTSFERTLMWISGFKPSLIFRLLASSVPNLTPPQSAAVEHLKAEVKHKERTLSEAMASLQEAVAAPPILELMRRAGTGRLVDGEVDEMESAIEELKMGMLGVFDRADLLRGSTVMQLIQILNPDQSVRLLAAAADFQLRIRRWGLPRNLHTTT